MARYYQNFTLLDIFNNEQLKNKLPLVNYKKTQTEDGKTRRRTNMKSVTALVFETAKNSAKPFYKPLKAVRSGNIISFNGKLIGDHNEAVDSVYNALLGIKPMLIYTANNADMIRDALKEAEKSKVNYGFSSKLYLRAISIEEIKGMNNKQIQALLNNIMENIFYSDNFPQTQKKWNIPNLQVNSPYTYEQRKQQWKERVGDI